jgi:hypothetical protein
MQRAGRERQAGAHREREHQAHALVMVRDSHEQTRADHASERNGGEQKTNPGRTGVQLGGVRRGEPFRHHPHRVEPGKREQSPQHRGAEHEAGSGPQLRAVRLGDVVGRRTRDDPHHDRERCEEKRQRIEREGETGAERGY